MYVYVDEGVSSRAYNLGAALGMGQVHRTGYGIWSGFEGGR